MLSSGNQERIIYGHSSLLARHPTIFIAPKTSKLCEIASNRHLVWKILTMMVPSEAPKCPVFVLSRTPLEISRLTIFHATD
jgi:hypothetical protein